ncbi:MAG: 23S rRNA (pseudouridine(1915)-N(3))-methyltransferase RlmH [Desulfovibrio sp.]|nr:23S rRNA (pseudouridine(1915)-N(3))-methyltransferase RlmH [Desulfovibrio sp.]
MKSRGIDLICVGKLKTAWWKEASAHYLSMLRKWRDIRLLETRDGDSSLSIRDRKTREAEFISRVIEPGQRLIGLHETGSIFTSRGLADFLRRLDEKEPRRVAFIVGGPFGLADSLLESCSTLVSLSAFTFPHELARVILLEQLFRAESILRRFPYHH